MNQEVLGYIFFGLYWVVFIYSIVLHEIAHGYSSYLMGDPTAWKAGRLTLNPIRHIDPVMSIIVPLAFMLTMGAPWGGAKPVPVNPYLYKNVRWGSLLSAAAGPATNLVLTAFFAGLFVFFKWQAHGEPTLTARFLCSCMLLNLLLAVFNMFPVPPLDGSHVLGSLLPRSLWDSWGKLQALGFMPIFVLVIINRMVWPVIGLPLLYAALLVLGLLGADGREWWSTFRAVNLLR